MKSILLDTCALIWLGNGQNELTPDAKDQISNAENVYVSAISLWEISNKCRLGKLQLKLPVREWFSAICRRHEVTPLPVDVDDMIAAGELPDHHKDPADRMIIALALRRGMAVVTRDRNFSKYGVKTLE